MYMEAGRSLHHQPRDGVLASGAHVGVALSQLKPRRVIACVRDHHFGRLVGTLGDKGHRDEK